MCSKTDPKIHHLYENEAIIALHLVNLLEHQDIPIPDRLPIELKHFLNFGNHYLALESSKLVFDETQIFQDRLLE